MTVKKDQPAETIWRYTYNLAGRLIVRVGSNNTTITYIYDVAEHLTLIDYPALDVDGFLTCNVAGQQMTMTDGPGTITWNLR